MIPAGTSLRSAVPAVGRAVLLLAPLVARPIDDSADPGKTDRLRDAAVRTVLSS